MIFKRKKFELGSAIGVFKNKIIGGKYKICPECGRIYNHKANYCSMCEKTVELIEIEIKL